MCRAFCAELYVSSFLGEVSFYAEFFVPGLRVYYFGHSFCAEFFVSSFLVASYFLILQEAERKYTSNLTIIKFEAYIFNLLFTGN